MKILVTGWSGFIGRALVAQLVRRFGTESLICLARAPASPAELAAETWAAAAGIRIITADLRDPGVSSETLPPLDLVFHLAANIDTDAPLAEMAANDQGTAHMLEWAGGSLAASRVVYTSSVAAMDRGGPAEGPLHEDSPCTPRTAYGLSKLRGEQVIRAAADQWNYTYTILRLPTVYGPGQKVGGLFDRLASYAADRAPAGRLDWPGRTSVIFLDDIARALVSLALAEPAANRIVCVAGEHAPTVGELSRAIGAAIGHPIAPLRVPRAIWRLVRRLVWLPGVPALVPSRAAVAFWRLTLIVDDGFWFDTSRFRALCPDRLIPLDEALRLTFSSEHAAGDRAEAGVQRDGA